MEGRRSMQPPLHAPALRHIAPMAAEPSTTAITKAMVEADAPPGSSMPSLYNEEMEIGRNIQ